MSSHRGLTSTSQGSLGSSLPSPVASPQFNARRRVSAPDPVNPPPNPRHRRGSLQPRMPNSPNTRPWHGQSPESGAPSPWGPAPSDQDLPDFSGMYSSGASVCQAPQIASGSSVGPLVDPTTPRSTPYGRPSLASDSVQPTPSSMPPMLTRRHTFPNEWAGAQDMVRYFSLMGHNAGSVPGSPANPRYLGKRVGSINEREPSTQGNAGWREVNYGSGGGGCLESTGACNRSSTGYAGVGALEDAIMSQHFERVAGLLEQGLSPNGERGSPKGPPLIYAVNTGNERLVKLLLSAGANINDSDSRQHTALHHAAASGHRGIVKLLLVAGANLYAKTDGNLLPVQLAADNGIYNFLIARMRSDMDDRLGPNQGRPPPSPPSPWTPARSPGFSGSGRDQRNEGAWHDRSGSGMWIGDVVGGSERSIQSRRIMPDGSPGFSDVGMSYNREAASSSQIYGEPHSLNLPTHTEYVGPDRQNVFDPVRQTVVSAKRSDGEKFREFPSEVPYQGYEQWISFSDSQGLNSPSNKGPRVERNNQSPTDGRQGVIHAIQGHGGHLPNVSEKWEGYEDVDASRPSSASSLSSTPSGPGLQESAPNMDGDNRPISAPMQRSTFAPQEMRQEERLQQALLEKVSGGLEGAAEVSSIAVAGETQLAGLSGERQGSDEDSRMEDGAGLFEKEDPDPHKTRGQGKFLNACDSMAPMMFKRNSSKVVDPCNSHGGGEPLMEGVTGTPQGPETPRQLSESQGVGCMGQVSQISRPGSVQIGGISDGGGPLGHEIKLYNSEKKKLGGGDALPISALKAEVKPKTKERKSVKFAPLEPSEEDLASIRKDWHDAARAGCVGCGKAGCEGQCLRPQEPDSVLVEKGSSCSNSDDPEELFTHAEPTTTGTFVWTRGELIGEGAYGKVFAGLNQQTGELMAVKQLKLDTPAEGQERQFYLAALEREISLYKKMRHKHIVGYINMEQDVTSGSLYVFLEYVSGGSIQSMLERFGRFSESLVRVYTRQLLLGLEYLHSKKIVHRDIKGGNVLVDSDGVIKLADFGASKAFHDPTQTDGFKSIRGSVFWMAPEVIKGDGYGRRADIWSVGCTVVEMLTATHPWPGMDNTWTAIFHIAKASSGPPIPETTSDIVKDFLSHCFQLDPKLRPTATELLQHPFVAEPTTQT